MNQFSILIFLFFRALLGKTVFVSGGSRGIGKAIALKLAKDGAKIIIAAKTTEKHPKLEGTIYSAAEESELDFSSNLLCSQKQSFGFS